jgi:hypothetical protein
MEYDELEDQLVALFGKDKDENGELIPEFFDIKPCPEFESEYSANAMAKTRVFCYYDSSDYSNTEPIDAVMQEETISIGFDIRARARRGDVGIFATAKRIKKVILGYKIPGYDKFQLSTLVPNINPKNPSPNDWHYSLQFTTTTHICEDQPDTEQNVYNLITPEIISQPL